MISSFAIVVVIALAVALHDEGHAPVSAVPPVVPEFVVETST